MSKQLLNDKWCIRCNREDPTPYLVKHWQMLVRDSITDNDKYKQAILDIGCGNGRNMEFLRSKGYTHIMGVDMAKDPGQKCVLGVDKLPCSDHSVNVILANYVFMFLNSKERKQVIREIQRVASSGCMLMIELYPAKDSEAPNEQALVKLQAELIEAFDWQVKHNVKERCILQS